MKDRYIVDTNVLIAASAGKPSAPKEIDATPKEPEIRLQVWQWLSDFKESDSRLILDSEGKIYEEYTRKLGFNDFGIEVVMHKWSTSAADVVEVEYDADGHGLLLAPLDTVIHDLADKKMVAAALSANKVHGCSCIAFAGDTDWHDWEIALHDAGVELEPIIEDWSRAKYHEKLAKKIRSKDSITDFFRFPHTPHLAWLAKGEPRDDKVLSQNEVRTLLAEEVVVEEKLDGANLGLSFGEDGHIRAQNRGQYLCEPYSGQFSRLGTWLAQHGEALATALSDNLIVFGEWCAAKHSMTYEALPDWLLIFDVYDRTQQQFWSTSRRNALAAKAGLVTVPELKRAKLTLPELKDMLTTYPSHYRSGPLEGIIIRSESKDECTARAKLVRADFTQAIGEHWSKRSIEWNRLKTVDKS